MMRCRCAVIALLIMQACGVERIELAPEREDVFVLGPVPADALAALERSPEGKPEPPLQLSYPPDGTAIPANLAPIRFLFAGNKKGMEPMKPAMGSFRAFELRIQGRATDLRIYTADEEASLPAPRWRTLLTQEQGGELRIVLRAIGDGDRVITSQPVQLRVLEPTRPGLVHYWSDSRSAALSVNLELGLDAARSSSSYPSLDPWQALNQDASQEAMTEAGTLSVRIDGEPLPLAWADGLSIETPCWSPDGASLVFVAHPGAPLPAPEMGMQKASIMRARLVDRSSLSEPELVFSADKPDTDLRAPAYSPDGRFLAFEEAKGRDKPGTLSIVPAEGGGALALAPKLSWKGEGAYPAWIASRREEQLWLLFSQNRAPGQDKLASDQLQLWALALQVQLDGRLQALGEPFWLPQQSADESNRRALFREE